MKGFGEYRFWIEQMQDGKWHRLEFESNSVNYCHGFIDSCIEFCPNDQFRICKKATPATFKVLREVGWKHEISRLIRECIYVFYRRFVPLGRYGRLWFLYSFIP